MYKDVAVIGMAGRFPLSANIDEFQNNLRSGKDMVTDISFERRVNSLVAAEGEFIPQGYLEDIDKFDYSLFNILPGEAACIDPQQRLLLEVVYEALENAGYDIGFFEGKNVSVLVGDITTNYFKLAGENATDPLLITGNINANAAGRISRYFKLTGKALMIDTACSSSLVAIHEACMELAMGETEYVIVCGVNINLFPAQKGADKTGLLSSDGKVRSFDIMADGTGIGEAAACVLLQLKEQALVSGNRIHAVIKGSAVNQDAHRSANLSSPSSLAQAEVLGKAWKRAGVDAAAITYIEAHGTGTKLGDPLEIEGMNMAFRQLTDKKHFCAVSSVKSNIGHCSSASGVVSLIKVILSLKNKELFPSLHFHRPNPFIDFERSAVFVNKELREWLPEGNRPRIAGISSFGISGTNCHIVVGEAPAVAQADGARAAGAGNFFVVSGRTPNALKQNAKALLSYLQKNKEIDPARLEYTLTTGRKHYEFRHIIRAADPATCAEKLNHDLEGGQFSYFSGVRKCWIAFSGDQIVSPADIDLFRQSFPVFERCWDEVISCVPDKVMDENLRRLVFQCGLFRVMEEQGMGSRNFIGSGRAKISIEVIKRKMTLADAVKALRNYHQNENVDLRTSLRNFLTKELRGDAFLFEAGDSGEISVILKEIAEEDDSRCDILCLARGSHGIDYTGMVIAMYLRGIPINWEAYYGHIKMQKVELPPYQFERQVCWIRDMSETPDYRPLKWLYRLTWAMEPLAAEDTQEYSFDGRTYLISCGDTPVALNFVRLLEEKGCTCIFVGSGESYAEYKTFRDEIDTTHIDGVIHFEDTVEDTDDMEDVSSALRKHLYHKYYLYNALGVRLADPGLRIFCVSLNAHAMEGATLSPINHLGYTFFKSLVSDFPGVAVKLVDFADGQSAVATMIHQEFIRDTVPLLAMYREGRRFVKRLEKVSLTQLRMKPLVKEGGVYVIAGGLGSIGLETCLHLLSCKKCNIICLGRKKGEDPEVIEGMRKLRKGNVHGSLIVYHTVDISETKEMKILFAELYRTFGKINGVIHSTATMKKTNLVSDVPDELETVMGSKIYGCLNLRRCVDLSSLDYFIMYSSLNSVVPRKSTMAYAVANSFEDAFSQYLREKGVDSIAINWGDWGEIRKSKGGQLTDTENRFVNYFSNKDGIRALRLAACFRGPNVITADLNSRYLFTNPFFKVEEDDGQQPEELVFSGSETEKRLAAIWNAVLNIRKLDPDDEFLKVGGHSLIATQMRNRIEREFMVEISMRDLLERYPTIRKMALHIDNMIISGKALHEEMILPIAPALYYDLSYGQRGIWLAHHMENDNSSYNMVIALRGNFSPEILEMSVARVVRKYEVLRTTFRAMDTGITQVIGDGENIHIEVGREAVAPDARILIRQELGHRFDLEEGPLVRVRLIMGQGSKPLLLVNFHHIIMDGLSVRRFFEELISNYESIRSGHPADTEAMKLQYKDYAASHNHYMASNQAFLSLEYWRKKLTDREPVRLETDFVRQATKTFSGDRVEFTFDEKQTEALMSFSRKLNSTLFTTLISIVKALIVRVCGKGEIAIGIQSSGRDRKELEDQLGYFVNTLVVTDMIGPEENFLEILKKVKNTMMEAYKYGRYPYQALVEKVHRKKSGEYRNPFFDIEVNMDEAIHENEALAGGPLEIEFAGVPSGTSKYELSFNFTKGHKLGVSLIYNTDIFERRSIEALAAKFIRLTDAIISNPVVPVGKVALTTHIANKPDKLTMNENF